MYKIGLCSVTFRDLTVEQVIKAAKRAEITGIEWGGDVHVPPGDFERTAEVVAQMEQAHLETVAYGSYYFLGDKTGTSFENILATAKSLQAPAIRVWAGKLGSDATDEDQRQAVVEDARRIAAMADKENIIIQLEYHGGTLTDTAESASLLMEEISHPNAYLYWQPALNQTRAERLNSIDKVKSRVTHLHVFHWHGTDRQPFAAGAGDWEQYLKSFKKEKGVRYLLMEFVKGDRVEQLLDDVHELRKLTNELNR